MGAFKYNFGQDTSLTNDLLSLIKRAKKYVKICSFLVHDKEVVDLLENKAKEIAVFILSNRQSNEVYEYEADIPMDANAQTNNLVHLELSGAHVRLLDGLHAKLIIIDGEYACLTSANLSHNSLRKNIETGVFLQGKDLIEAELLFDTLFAGADGHLDILKNALVFNRKSVPIDDSFIKGFQGNLCITLAPNSDDRSVISNCSTKTLFSQIISIIDNASRSLYIVTWHFNLLDKYGKDMLRAFSYSLIRAAERGVDINFFSDPLGEERSVKRNMGSESFLKSVIPSCKIIHVNNNHSKCVINENEGLILTGNIDYSHGLEHGFELGCIMDSEQLKVQQEIIKRMTIVGKS